MATENPTLSKLMVLAAAAVLGCAALAGCGSTPSDTANSTADNSNAPAETADNSNASDVEAEVEDDGSGDVQDAIMNYVGTYVCDRANIRIEAEEPGVVKATVHWASSVSEDTEWVLTGAFDDNTLTMSYEGGTQTHYVYASNGEIDKEEVVYTDGTGTIKFEDGDPITLTWNDAKEHVADGMTFEFNAEAE